jgi:hypothetical protein
MNSFKLRKKINRDEKGALEGLPLYLIILVVITAIAIVIMITWLSTMQEPDLDRIEIDTGTSDGTLTDDGSAKNVKITAKGTNGMELEGVSVTLEGAGITPKTLKTGDGGIAEFTITPDLPPNTYTGSITVTATYSGNIMVTKIDTIPVNKG